MRTGGSGEQMLLQAQAPLDLAKIQAHNTLKPILDCMRKSRKIKSADQVLRRLASTLEHPHKMRLALERGDLDETVAIYRRVQV